MYLYRVELLKHIDVLWQHNGSRWNWLFFRSGLRGSQCSQCLCLTSWPTVGTQAQNICWLFQSTLDIYVCYRRLCASLNAVDFKSVQKKTVLTGELDVFFWNVFKPSALSSYSLTHEMPSPRWLTGFDSTWPFPSERSCWVFVHTGSIRKCL